MNYDSGLNRQLNTADIILNNARLIMPNKMGPIAISPTLFLRSSRVDDLVMLPSTSTGTRQETPPADTPNPSPKEQPSVGERPMRMVPACSICGADSTGIHFGVDACAACSAFFRRTVVLNKQYGCNKDGKCQVTRDGSGGQKCRSCRFAKCIRVGMDRNAVQLRRDAIGKYSSAVKRECISPGPTEPKSLSPPSPKIMRQETFSILEELSSSHALLMKKRKIFYANKSCQELFQTDELEIVELHDFEECMYQLWRIEPRLAAEFIDGNKFLASIPPKEKVKLFRNFVVIRQAVEEPFLTWKFGGLEKNWWVMPNRTYIDIDHAEKYFTTGKLKNLNLTYEVAKGLFEGSLKSAMSTIGTAMRNMELSETEMIALCGIALMDPTVATLTEETKTLLWGLREQLVREMFNFYDASDSIEDPELRLANLFMILAAIKVHSIRTSENMHLLNTFQLIAKDKMFEDICRGNVYEEENSSSQGLS